LAKRNSEPELLKSRQAIAKFLGQPVAVLERWAKEGMPVSRQGGFVVASPEELNAWLGCESAGEPVDLSTDSSDLAADLRKGLGYVRQHRKEVSKKGVDQSTQGAERGGYDAHLPHHRKDQVVDEVKIAWRSPFAPAE